MDPRDVITKDLTKGKLARWVGRRVKKTPRTIRGAMKRGKKVKFKYTPVGDGKTGTRTVEPYSFRTGKSGEALLAVDAKKGEIRRYILSGIEKPKRLKGKYKPQWPVERG